MITLFALALAVPATGEDCGIVAGERWWLARGGAALVSDDGARVVEDWGRCAIPAGVTIGLRIADDPPPPRVTLRVTPPCRNADAWIAAEVPKARAYLVARGTADDAIAVETLRCGTPGIDAVAQAP